MHSVYTLLARHPVNYHRTLAFQEADQKRNAQLRRDRQAHVNVVGHHMPFHHFNSFLPTQLFYDWADLLSQFSIQQFLPILRYNHDMVFAVPLHMGLALPVMHTALLSSPSRPSEGRAYFTCRRCSRRNGRAWERPRPKAVVSKCNDQGRVLTT